MFKPFCSECYRLVEQEDCYRCRICRENFCHDCSLDHFGLYQDGNKVRYKSVFKQLVWIIKKQLGVFDKNGKV